MEDSAGTRRTSSKVRLSETFSEIIGFLVVKEEIIK
jgi:hypothetical protein